MEWTDTSEAENVFEIPIVLMIKFREAWPHTERASEGAKVNENLVGN